MDRLRERRRPLDGFQWGRLSVPLLAFRQLERPFSEGMNGERQVNVTKQGEVSS